MHRASPGQIASSATEGRGGTSDAGLPYTWDAENRLIKVEPDGTPVNGDKKVEFVYDFLGRRVEKKVSAHNGTSWSVSDRRRFVWSDWLPVLSRTWIRPGPE